MELKITNCPGSLKEGFSSYSKPILKKMFNGQKISPILPYLSPTSAEEKEIFNENQTHISISGFQEKYSLILDGKNLRLTHKDEHGQYILKPISDLPKNKEYAPANEHLTMQIAQQVFKMEVAENALIFFADGSPAYITKRFDRLENSSLVESKKENKLAVEDFASLLQKSPPTHGEQYKYEGSYFELFEGLKKYIPAWKVEAPKLFTLILFNYLFSNGDAHLKNFSIIETQQGDYKLSPAYDLLNTRIHIEDSKFALKEGLLPKSISKGNDLEQFILLAEKAEIPQKTIMKIISNLTSSHEKIGQLTDHSFLSEKLKRNYLQAYQGRLNRLKKDMS